MRDRLAAPLLAVSERIASYDWDLVEVRKLLMALSSAMADELDVIAALPDASAGGG